MGIRTLDLKKSLHTMQYFTNESVKTIYAADICIHLFNYCLAFNYNIFISRIILYVILFIKPTSDTLVIFLCPLNSAQKPSVFGIIYILYTEIEDKLIG